MINSRLSFTELRRSLLDKSRESISSRVLTDKLIELEKEKIVTRHDHYYEKPPRVYYSLTPKGLDFEIIFKAMKAWGIRWGDLKQKKCRTNTCVHNVIQPLEFEVKSTDKLLELI